LSWLAPGCKSITLAARKVTTNISASGLLKEGRITLDELLIVDFDASGGVLGIELLGPAFSQTT
jgi:hypothetical protein